MPGEGRTVPDIVAVLPHSDKFRSEEVAKGMSFASSAGHYNYDDIGGTQWNIRWERYANLAVGWDVGL
jgi:hypothetical protein